MFPGDLWTLRILVRRELKGHQDHVFQRNDFARTKEIHELQYASIGIHIRWRRSQVRTHSLSNRTRRLVHKIT